MQSGAVSNHYSRAKRRMVDSHVQRSLNLLHVNKSNQVDILSDTSCFGEDLPKEEYMGTSRIPLQVEELFNDCVVAYSGHPDQLLQHIDDATLNQSSVLVLEDDDAPTPEETFDRIDQLLTDQHKEAIEHLKRICRCCLSVRKDLQSLFENENCISDMIMAIATIQLSPTDKMPSQICMSCVLQLSRALSFKQQLETADVTLRHYIEQGYLNGMKLVSLEGSFLEDDPAITNIPYTENSIIIGPSEETQTCMDSERTIISSTNLIAIDPELHETVLLDPILSVPITDLAKEDHLLHPTHETQSDIQTFELASEIRQFFDNEEDAIDACTATIPDEDDLNTLLQPLETHQLPRTEPETDSYEDENEPDVEYIDEEIEMDDDEVSISNSNADLSKNGMDGESMVGVNPSATSSDCGDIEEVQYSEDLPTDNGHEFVPSTENEPVENDARKITSWACFVCKQTFEYLKQLQLHIKDNCDEKSMYCGTCKKGFEKQSDLERHAKSHATAANRNTFSCEDCEMKFSVERDLRIHRSIHRMDGKFVCAECNKEVSTIAKLKRHIRTHFADKPHKCSVCEMGFSERGSLTRHFRKHTNDVREKKHVCKICDKKYSDSYSLLVHIRMHTGERPWVCTDCGKAFIDSRLLNSHRKVHSTEKPYACTSCDRRFTHQSTLTTHIRTHTGEKPFICTVCGKSFIQSSNLVLHMRVHSGEKPYQCLVCSMRFTSSSTLTVHTRTHTNEKPYECKICKKKFGRSDMSTHMRTHTGERPFACTVCPNKFATSSQLYYHKRSHTGERPFECNVCQMTFGYGSHLKKHLMEHIIGSPKKSTDVTTTAPLRAILNNPSTLDAINELARASTTDNSGKDSCSELQFVAPDQSLLRTEDINSPQIYRTINPNIFRIEKVQSVGQKL